MRQNGQLPANNWKGKFLNKYETVKSLPELKKHYSFLKEVDSIALQKSVENLVIPMIAITKNKINNLDLSQKRILFNLIQPSIRMEI